jgi:hypothetical protein
MNKNILSLTEAQTDVYNDVINYFDFPIKYNNEKSEDVNNVKSTNKNIIKNNKKNDKEIKDTTKKNNEYLLIGYAGTGKTTLITKLIMDLINNKRCKNIAIAAPTHKAVNIAKSKLFAIINNDEIISKHIHIMTIHRLLNYQSNINSEGEKIFEKSKLEPTWNKYDLVVIDECSMLSDQIIDDIETILNDKKNKNVKVLYVGDPAQLPPVNQKNSRIFNKQIKMNVLEQIIRTNNIKIMELSNDHRRWISDKTDANIPKISKYIHDKIRAFRKKDETLWLDDYIDNFKNSENNSGYNNSIILTWTNKKCNKYNKYIRQSIFNKDDLDYYENGEILILNDFHRILDESEEDIEPDKNNKNNETTDNKKKYISFYTSEQIKIKKIKKCNYKFNKIKVNMSNELSPEINNVIKTKVSEINDLLTENIQVFKLTVNKMSELNELDKKAEKYKIYTVHKESQVTYDVMLIKIDRIINEIKEKTMINLVLKNKKIKMTNMKKCTIYNEIDKKINKLYKEIQNNVIDCFAKLNYGYCITVHKSQGSTFENVYVDLEDIFNNNDDEETMKCIYTAITRTSNTLQFLING